MSTTTVANHIVATKRAVGYLRVSSTGQVGERHSSLDTQKARFEEYCHRFDLLPVASFVDVLSGKRDDRKEYLRMVEFVMPDQDSGKQRRSRHPKPTQDSGRSDLEFRRCWRHRVRYYLVPRVPAGAASLFGRVIAVRRERWATHRKQCQLAQEFGPER